MSSYGFKKGSLIDVIYDPKTGKEIPARDVVKDDHTGLTLRTELKTAKLRGAPLYLCPLCHTPIYLKSGVERQGQFFAHWPCRWMEKHEYSQEQIRARRFHGQRESHAHKQTKGFVYKCLEVDPSFSSIKVEKVWKSTTDEGRWRKPDGNPPEK
ncbi:hypothetical protein [Pseudodesulfovibrio senegalensis]|uniref:DUF7830 domain-containing protein n=1 Tax=Pseudodesulfovibrio senegalensis TaxID=1721087 RepID=A0A6N6N5W6_9BACT|nr:hypothetical protein [Pseudodesulfovibrio senegalensis]KAB1443572.1 hypothetical protein F8A88_04825 [Pseudodesulfovibrio senegalensis]